MVEADPSKVAEPSWDPLESDPDIFTKYQEALGFPKSASLQWYDVYGFDEECWTVFIPQPVVGAVLCYKIEE